MTKRRAIMGRIEDGLDASNGAAQGTQQGAEATAGTGRETNVGAVKNALKTMRTRFSDITLLNTHTPPR
jgi:hypothetical protein